MKWEDLLRWAKSKEASFLKDDLLKALSEGVPEMVELLEQSFSLPASQELTRKGMLMYAYWSVHASPIGDAKHPYYKKLIEELDEVLPKGEALVSLFGEKALETSQEVANEFMSADFSYQDVLEVFSDSLVFKNCLPEGLSEFQKEDASVLAWIVKTCTNLLMPISSCQMSVFRLERSASLLFGRNTLYVPGLEGHPLQKVPLFSLEELEEDEIIFVSKDEKIYATRIPPFVLRGIPEKEWMYQTLRESGESIKKATETILEEVFNPPVKE